MALLVNICAWYRFLRNSGVEYSKIKELIDLLPGFTASDSMVQNALAKMPEIDTFLSNKMDLKQYVINLLVILSNM